MTEHEQHERREASRNRWQKRRDFLWWVAAVSTVGAAILVIISVFSKAGVFAVWATQTPIRHEIAAAADTADRWPAVRRLMRHEEAERREADSLAAVRSDVHHDDVMRELGNIERALARRGER